MDTKLTLVTVANSKTVCVKLDNEGNEKCSVLESETDKSKYIYPYFSYENGNKSILIVKSITNFLFQGTGSSNHTITFGELNLK
ncbi:MAG: hypothetical protein ACOYM7_03970 [Paludibacter sp.]